MTFNRPYVQEFPVAAYSCRRARSKKTFRESSTLVPGNNPAILYQLVSKALDMNFRAGDVSFTLLRTRLCYTG